jgi:nucleoside-diphosphate-sugar epimerase
LDCRISAYTELDDTPNFIFIDIDSLDFAVTENVLKKCREFELVPTVIFTGSGYHVYQPVTPINLDNIPDFADYYTHKDLRNYAVR